jgi:signal transduction histidine kinase
VIPSFLTAFIVCLLDGMPLSWSLLIGLADPLSLALFALIYRSAPLRLDLRRWSSVCWFFITMTAAATASATGAFFWCAATHQDASQTLLQWKGWLLGCTLGTMLIVMPVLRLTMGAWQTFSSRWFPVQPRKESPFLFVTTVIGAAGLMMAALLTETSYMARIRLMEALRQGVPPQVATAIRDAVASWQGSAWSAIALVVTMMAAGLAHAYSWSARWKRQHEELAEAKRHAESALQVKSQFLATISHELRTPLNGILGMNQLVLETDLSEEQRDYVSMADQAGYQLLELVNNVLDLSKIEAGRLDLVYEPFDIRALVQQVAQLVGPKTQGKLVTLKTAIGELVPAMIDGDESRFRQIVLNLAGNAVKFTAKGHVLIEVDVSRASPPCLQVHVHDTGIGIAPEVLPTLFQPFTQADSSTTRRFGGTGLGLSISQRLAKAMDGAITIESVPGVGSTFTLTVPLYAKSAGPGPAHPEAVLLTAGH